MLNVSCKMNVDKDCQELLDSKLKSVKRQVKQLDPNVRKRKFFSDEDSDSSSLEDEDENQQKKLFAIMRSLPHYEPSQAMLHALDVNFSNESLDIGDPNFSAFMKSKLLDYDNVCSVLSTLLRIEDVSTMQLYIELMQTDVLLRKNNKLCYSFTLGKTQMNPEEVLTPYVDEVVLIPTASLLASPLPKQALLALIPHKHENLPLKDPMCRFLASVEQVTRSTVQIRFKRGALPVDPALSQRFLVILRSRRTPFRFMYRALQLLQESPQLRRYLFPVKMLPELIPFPFELPDLELFNQTIASNLEQLQAVKQIVCGPSSQAPYIVFGPPGTGKTTTIVEAILQLRLRQPRSRILVTAGSNSACDTIALRICEYFASNLQLQAQLVQHAQQSRLVTEDVEPDHQLIRVFSRSIYGRGLKSVNPLLLRHSNCAKNIYEHLRVDAVRRYGIIVATLGTVGRLVTENVGKFNFFTHVFIDEAGASTEPETLIGIMGIKQQDSCHVILSGDHKQLGAVIKSNRAANLGLGRSLMERLLGSELYALDDNGNYDDSLQTRLRRNYRSHPEIVGLYNRLYYNDELIAQAPSVQVNLAAKWHMLPNPKFPIIFQATHGKTQREMNSTSSFNALEAQVLCWYVKSLFVHGLGGGVRVQQQDIGIIAPYVAQCKLISELLRKLGFPNVEVGSVENYQGREKAIIIATLVRSFASMGFMRNPRRLNVLLSRAKSLMILIGNPVTLRYQRDIKFIINECKLQGNYLFKKKDGVQRPLFLNDMEDDELDETDSAAETDDDECSPWYAKMPVDISVAQPKQKQLQTDSSSGCLSSSVLTTSCSSSCPSTPELDTELCSQVAKLKLQGAEKIPIRTNFLKFCASASESTKQKLLKLQ